MGFAFPRRRVKQLLTPLLPEHEPARTRAAAASAAALRAWCERSRRPALGWSADADPLAAGPLAPYLVQAGFVRSGPGFRLDLHGQAPGAGADIPAGDTPAEEEPEAVE